MFIINSVIQSSFESILKSCPGIILIALSYTLQRHSKSNKTITRVMLDEHKQQAYIRRRKNQ